MGSETTYSGVLGLLGWLSAALGANAEDLAHLDGARLRLEKLVGDSEGTARQQAAFTASKQDASRRLRDLLVEGQRPASGMTQFLQERYGARSEKLAEFGLQPFRSRKLRTAKSAEQPTAPTPVPPAAHSVPAASTQQ
jgi:hypothetical protein